MSAPPILTRLARKLERHVPLSEEDRAAVLALPWRAQTIERSMYFVREGERTERACFMLDGFAFRQKVTAQGARQILSVHMPGDFVDLQNALLNVADHNVQALTRCELACVARGDLLALIAARPNVAKALWIETLIDASIFREWVVNVGRRDAKARIAHLLCEFARRIEVAGLGDTNGYELPMTQEQLGDAAGLTPVHVNRMLRELDRSGVIRRTNRLVAITDWKGLRRIADFNENYLHLDQAAVEGERAA